PDFRVKNESIHRRRNRQLTALDHFAPVRMIRFGRRDALLPTTLDGFVGGFRVGFLAGLLVGFPFFLQRALDAVIDKAGGVRLLPSFEVGPRFVLVASFAEGRRFRLLQFLFGLRGRRLRVYAWF